MKSQESKGGTLLKRPLEGEPPVYEYRCVDDSILLPYLKSWIITPLERFIPRWVSANDVTVISNVGSWGSLLTVLLLLRFPTAPQWLWVIPGFLVFFYLVMDNLDGTLARKRGLSSTRGEFLDHWCDFLNAGLAPIAVGVAAGFPHFVTFSLVVVCVLGFMVGVSEQLRTGWCRWSKIGGVEGLLAMALIFISMAFTGPDAFMGIHIFGWPLWLVLCIGVWVATLVIYVGVMQRVSWRFLLEDTGPYLVSAAGAYLWLHFGGLHPYETMALITGLGALIGGRMIIFRTTQRRKSPDRLILGTPIAMGLLFATGLAIPFGVSQMVFAIIMAYTVVRLAMDVWSALMETEGPEQVVGVMDRLFPY